MCYYKCHKNDSICSNLKSDALKENLDVDICMLELEKYFNILLEKAFI